MLTSLAREEGGPGGTAAEEVGTGSMAVSSSRNAVNGGASLNTIGRSGDVTGTASRRCNTAGAVL